MSDISRNHYSALVVRDDRLQLWAEECVNLHLTAGQVVGTPTEPGGQRSGMALRALRRARTGSHDSIEVTTRTGGMPALTGQAVGQAASYVWSPDGTTSYGWDSPTVPAGYRSLLVTDGTGTFKHARYPHACVTSINSCLVAYEVEFSTARQIRLRRKVQGSSDWGAGAAIVTGLDADKASHPCLLTLPSGRVILYYFVSGNHFVTQTSSDQPVAYIKAIYSDDDGVTWATLAESVTGTVFDLNAAAVGDDVYAPGQLRAAASPNGQVVLFASMGVAANTHGAGKVVLQYASSDGGISFDLVARTLDTTADNGAELADVICDGDVFVIAWHKVADPGGSSACVARLGSAYQCWLTADRVELDSLAVWAHCLAITRTEDGVLYVYSVQANNGAPHVLSGVTFASFDRGRSWTQTPDDAFGDESWFGNGETGVGAFSTAPVALAAVCHEGRVLMVHTRAATGTAGVASASSVSVLYLGGYTTVTAPVSGPHGWAGFQAGYTETWLPYDMPEDVGWTKAGTHSTIELDSHGALHHAEASGSGSTCSYTWDLPESDNNDGAFGSFTAHTPSAAFRPVDNIAGMPVECFVTLSDGAGHTHGFRIALDSTHLRIHERTSATALLSMASETIAFPTNTAGDPIPMEIKWTLTDAGQCRVWRRFANDSALREWVEIADFACANIWSTVTTSSIVMAANLAAGTEASFFGCSWNNLPGDRSENLYTQDSAEINGRPYSVTGTYITDTAIVSATSGPTTIRETWTIGSSYDFDAARTLLPNPRTGWRSVDTSADISLAYRFAPDGNEVQPKDVLALCFARTNIGRVKVSYYEATSAVWTTPVAFDLTHGDLRWQRKAAVVYPLTGSYTGKPTPLHREGEWDGAQVVLASGVTRKIKRSIEGKWKASGALPRLYIEGVTGTEGTSGTTGRIIARDAVVPISLNSAIYSAIRITIPSPATDAAQYRPAEGYWRLGSFLPGAVYLNADETSWGRALESYSRTETITYDDGTVARRALGPVGRRVEINWADGIDTSHASTDADDPDTHTLDSFAIAQRGMTPWTIDGLFRLLAETVSPVVYLPRVEPFVGSAPQVFNRREQLMLGIIESDSVRLDSVQGNENEGGGGDGEVFRIGTITIGELT